MNNLFIPAIQMVFDIYSFIFTLLPAVLFCIENLISKTIKVLFYKMLLAFFMFLHHFVKLSYN